MTVSDGDILQLIKTLKINGGYNFENYSIKSFTRRIEKIIMDNRTDIYAINNRLKVDRQFLEHVVKEITVNTTELFRDPQIWQAIKYRVLPRLVDKKQINIWHAGCSIGLEVYSMLILLSESGLLHKTNIYATDINTDVLSIAQKGEYNYRLNIEYLDNFDKAMRKNPLNFDEHIDLPFDKYLEFNQLKDYIKIKPSLLGKAVFKKHDLVNDTNPFDIKYDIILCRNVLIYFNHDLQNKILADFRNYLLENGTLVLGIHESILGAPSAGFTKKGFIYTKNAI